jgi:hypothetical protein
MPAPRTIDQWLAQLRTLAIEEPAARELLGKALRLDRQGAGVVIAAAVKHVIELAELDPDGAEPLIAELPAAFERLLADPTKRDPQCRGKAAIARALHELDRWEERVFVRGLVVVQLEGWGPHLDDMAAELRGICGLAHAHFARADALDVLAELMADGERITREAAARGLGDAGRPDASALLRYVVLANEAEPEVLAACFESLLALGRDQAIGFAIRFLDEDDDRAEAAALALGSVRAADAACEAEATGAGHTAGAGEAPVARGRGVIDALIAWCDRCSRERRHRAGYLALALLRSDRANEHLLDVVRTRARAEAIAAARALATFREVPGIAEQLAHAARAVKDPAVRAAISELLAA